MPAHLDPAQLDLVLWLGSRSLAALEPSSFVAEVARRLPATLHAPAAVVHALDPEALAGSSPDATHLGEAQTRAAAGPLATAVRSGRPLVVPDLTRVGPPALAAGAAQVGLLSCVVVPLAVDGRAVGALQLLGTAEQPVGEGHLGGATAVADVLAARLADLAYRARLAAEVARLAARPAVVPQPRAEQDSRDVESTTEVLRVPRHRKRAT